jgi:hypothetical protein
MNVGQLVHVAQVDLGKINKLVTCGGGDSSLGSSEGRIVHLSAAAQMVCKLAALIYE